MSDSTGKNIRRNVRASMVAWIWYASMSMLRLPVLFTYLTEAEYGMWLAAWSITIIFSVQNFGVSTALINYTAHHQAREEYEILNEKVNTGLFFTILIMSLMFGLFILFIDHVIGFLNLGTEEWAASARLVLVGVALATVISITTHSMDAVIVGMQRLDIRDLTRTVVYTAEFIAVITALYLGYGLRGVVVLNVCGALVYMIVVFLIVPRINPHVRINPFKFRVRQIREIFMYGGKMQILGFGALTSGMLHTFLLTRLLGPAFIGLSGASDRIAKVAQSAALVGFGALAPASAHLIARGELDQVKNVYRATLRLTAVGCIWIFAYLAVFSDVVMAMFLGDNFHELSARTLTIVSISYFIHSLTGAGSSMLRGAGKPMLELTYLILAMVLFLALLLPNFLGLVAVTPPLTKLEVSMPDHAQYVAYWPAALASSSLFFLVLANRRFGVHWFTPFDRVALPVLAAPAIAFCVHALWEHGPIPWPDTRFECLVGILASGILYSAIYLPMTWFMPGLDADDKNRIVGFFPGGQRLRKRLIRKSQR
jgi:O-antigen/teichoic acid export membrane protein